MAPTNNMRAGIEPKATQETNNQPSNENVRSNSLGGAIAKGLGIEDQGIIDRAISLAKDYMGSTQRYIKGNPSEAIAVCTVAGAALWAALCTEPGKKMIQSGKTVAFPQLTKWLNENLRSKNIH